MTVAFFEDHMTSATQKKMTPEEVIKAEALERQEEAETFKEYVGVFLRMERRQKKMTQDDVAEKSGRSKGWVSQMENGMNDSSSSAKLYCLAVGVDYAYIVALAESSIDTKKRQGA